MRLNTLTINWGSLGVGGMVAEERYVRWMEQIGVEQCRSRTAESLLDAKEIKEELGGLPLVVTSIGDGHWDRCNRKDHRGAGRE